MMPDGLATTHDPAGHNLPHDTPAICAFLPLRSLPRHSRPGGPEMRDSTLWIPTRKDAERCRKYRIDRDIACANATDGLPDTSNYEVRVPFGASKMRYDNLTRVYLVTFKYIQLIFRGRARRTHAKKRREEDREKNFSKS